MKRLINFSIKAVRQYIEIGISGMSLQLSYYMLFSVFPLIIFASTVLSRLFPQFLTGFSAYPDFIPEKIYDFMADFFKESSFEGGNGITVTSLVLFLYLLTRYIRCLRLFVGKIYGITIKMGFFREWAYSLLLSAAIFLLFLLSVFCFFIADIITDTIFTNSPSKGILMILRFFVPGIYAFSVLLLIHKSRLGAVFKIKRAWVGCCFAVLGWIIISALFSYYTKISVNYNLLYGSVGNVIILMVWLNLTNTALLCSAFINVIFQNGVDLY